MVSDGGLGNQPEVRLKTVDLMGKSTERQTEVIVDKPTAMKTRRRDPFVFLNEVKITQKSAAAPLLNF